MAGNRGTPPPPPSSWDHDYHLNPSTDPSGMFGTPRSTSARGSSSFIDPSWDVHGAPRAAPSWLSANFYGPTYSGRTTSNIDLPSPTSTRTLNSSDSDWSANSGSRGEPAASTYTTSGAYRAHSIDLPSATSTHTLTPPDRDYYGPSTRHGTTSTTSRVPVTKRAAAQRGSSEDMSLARGSPYARSTTSGNHHPSGPSTSRGLHGRGAAAGSEWFDMPAPRRVPNLLRTKPRLVSSTSTSDSRTGGTTSENRHAFGEPGPSTFYGQGAAADVPLYNSHDDNLRPPHSTTAGVSAVNLEDSFHDCLPPREPRITSTTSDASVVTAEDSDDSTITLSPVSSTTSDFSVVTVEDSDDDFPPPPPATTSRRTELLEGIARRRVPNLLRKKAPAPSTITAANNNSKVTDPQKTSNLSTITSGSNNNNNNTKVNDLKKISVEENDKKKKEENDKKKKEEKYYVPCLTCNVEGRNCAYRPCGHVSCCYTCASSRNTCPRCYSPVTSALKIYLP